MSPAAGAARLAANAAAEGWPVTVGGAGCRWARRKDRPRPAATALRKSRKLRTGARPRGNQACGRNRGVLKRAGRCRYPGTARERGVALSVKHWTASEGYEHEGTALGTRTCASRAQAGLWMGSPALVYGWVPLRRRLPPRMISADHRPAAALHPATAKGSALETAGLGTAAGRQPRPLRRWRWRPLLKLHFRRPFWRLPTRSWSAAPDRR